MSPEMDLPASPSTQVPLPSSHFDSDAYAKKLSALHGNFIPLQSSEGLFLIPPQRARNLRRQRSQSPRRRQDQDVHLHLSLTDSQMDKLASTLARDNDTEMRPSHGTQMRQHDEASFPFLRDRVPLAASSAIPGSKRLVMEDSRDGHQYGIYDNRYESVLADCCVSTAYEKVRSSSPKKARPSPTEGCNRFATPALHIDAPPTYYEHKHEDAPCLATEDRLESSTSNTLQQYPDLRRLRGSREAEASDTSSSVYSLSELSDVLVNPLDINKVPDATACADVSTSLHEHASWSMVSPKLTSALSGRGSDSNQQSSEVRCPDSQRSEKGMYSPISVYDAEFSGLANYTDVPKSVAARRGRKIMVGKNGWLERTGDTDNAQPSSKKGGIFGTLKRMAKEVAEATDIKVVRRPKDGKQNRHMPRMRTSLNPREQSVLYSELEFLLTTALDGYITSQFNAGRLDADKYKKIADAWHHKGRPKVVGFRYDLETQLELVRLHVEEFRFYGDRAGVPVAVAGILEMMTLNSRAMRIRTFCQPDPVIAKQLLDSQSLLNLFGCSEPCQIQLAEIVQLFKVVLERESRAFPGENVHAAQASLAGHPLYWAH